MARLERPFANAHLAPAAEPQTRQTAYYTCKTCSTIFRNVGRWGCGVVRKELRWFVRSAEPHGPLEIWYHCHRCAAGSWGMRLDEFVELFLHPSEELFISRNDEARICTECDKMKPPRSFRRTLVTTERATAVPRICNECCMANWNLDDETGVNYSLPDDDLNKASPKRCISCDEEQPARSFVRSPNEPVFAPVVRDWRSCNHCAMRRGLFTALEFQFFFHGPIKM